MDYQGRTALQVAVRDQNEGLIAYLLSVPTIQLGDVLLHAVREGNVDVMKTLLEWKERWGCFPQSSIELYFLETVM